MSKRRDFLKAASLTGLALAHNNIFPVSSLAAAQEAAPDPPVITDISGNMDMNDLIDLNESSANVDGTNVEDGTGLSVIGLYGPWANALNKNRLPALSFRRPEFTNLGKWRKAARQRVIERMAIPGNEGKPKVTLNKKYTYDGLDIEEISWQLSYGRPVKAILLKPANATGKLPAVLGFHDHGGNKYFGCEKITKTSDTQHPLMKAHQEHYYSGAAWANEIAKLGYVVLVSDAFAFGSRRVMLQDVPARLRNNVTDGNDTDHESIEAYNTWANAHESIMAKSLFCAGTTWPAVFYLEDKIALDILCARPDVDPARVGCAGLSGGGLRTAFLAGLDERIKCAVNVGFTTTWADFLLNKSFTHTWMTYVPLLPNELDFPEIMGLRVPLATLVLNDREDQLYTLGEMQNAEKILTDVYKKAGAAERFKCSYYPGPHKFDNEMQREAFLWFDRWLKG